MTLTTIAFDADDTLWHNETFFRTTQAAFAERLAPYVDTDHLMARLDAVERKNLAWYGYGIKGFMLSMAETAIEVTDGRVPSSVIADILADGREMLRHPVELMPHVEETLDALAGRYRLLLVTKGDLFDQERKVAASGLADRFHMVEIVSEKTEATYRTIFGTHGDGPARAMMVGNSLRSDVIPALEAGAWGVHVPAELSWHHEHADPPNAERFIEIADLSALPPLLAAL